VGVEAEREEISVWFQPCGIPLRGRSECDNCGIPLSRLSAAGGELVGVFGEK
jgi:hypothetical protein